MAKKVVVFVLLITPFFLWEFFDSVKKFQEEKNTIISNLIQEVNISAGGHEYYIAKTKELLDSITLLRSVKNGDRGACKKDVASVVKNFQNSIYTGILVTDAKGDVWCSSSPLPAGGINIADREYFKNIIQTKSFIVGEYQIGRLSGIIGVPFAQPFIGENGETGVVAVQINLQELTKSLIDPDKPQNGQRVYNLLDGRGVLLARWPTNLESVGKSLDSSDEKFFFNLLQKKIALGLDDGVFEGWGLTGVWRVFAFSKIAPEIGGSEDIELYLLIGDKKSIFYTDAWVGLFKHFGVLAGVILISGVIFCLIQWAPTYKKP